MIKIVQARWLKGYQIDLTFSNSNVGVYDFAALLDQMAPLTRPLQDPVAFQKYFLELGALCWPNGLQISADKLHTELFVASLLANKKPRDHYFTYQVTLDRS